MKTKAPCLLCPLSQVQIPEGQRCLPDPERRKKQKRVQRAENGQQHDRADEHAAHAQLLSL